MNNENMKIRTRRLMACLIICLCLILNKSSAQQGAELGGNTLMANAWISTICSDPAGNIYAAGGFTNSSGKNYVAKWNGSAWSELGGGNALAANGGINSICRDAAGNIYAAGGFTNSSGKCYVAKWNGGTWSELGGTNALAANSNINSICADAAGNIYAGGNFQNSSGNYIVAKWNGSSWSQLGAGFNDIYGYDHGWINTLCTDPSGHVYAAGAFMDAVMDYYVAEWIDTAWIVLGGRGRGVNDAIASICSDPSGNIYAVGNFNSGYWTYVAKWDGSTWSELGQSSLNINNYVTVVYSDASGNIYIGGAFGDSISPSYIAKYNGTIWSQFGGSHMLPMNHGAFTICSDTTGNIYAGGTFTNSGGKEYVALFAKNEVVYNNWFDTICQGSSVIVGNQLYMASGTYADTLMAVQGGDSVVNLHLAIDTLRHAPTAGLTLDSMIALGDLSAGQGSLDTSFFWWNCLNPAVFRLTGGSPVGGIYSGRWISNDSIHIPPDLFNSTIVQTFVYTYTDSSGCYTNVFSSFPLTLCGDSNGIPSQSSLSLYPNPTNGSFTLVTNGSIGSKYTITDMMGKVVAQDIINSPSQNISLGLENGVYTLTIGQSINISILYGLYDYTTLGPQSMRFVVMR